MNLRARRLNLSLRQNLCLFLSALAFAAFGLPGAASGAPPTTAGPALRALIVGGGPRREFNQVGIESNVRYLKRILPPAAPLRTLFADGRLDSATVQYLDAQGHEQYRPTSLTTIDGPSTRTSLDQEFTRLRQSSGPLLLYFTGHGGPAPSGNFDNNTYGLWHEDDLKVTQLSSYLDTLPAATPITLVMVQCFSGAFGNLLFKSGDPQGEWADRNLCGFFAAVPEREAAGCTPDVDEADYHDFTSYFFAALSGHDRLGHSTTGADYDKNGRVGMDEAFAYTLLHDASIDTPVCTSDVFLRRYVTTSDADIFATPYQQVLGWATPAQHAALEGLSSQLGLSGQGRLAKALDTMTQRLIREAKSGGQDDQNDAEATLTARWIRMVRLSKSVVLAHTLQQNGTPVMKQRFAALRAAEAGNPIHPG